MRNKRSINHLCSEAQIHEVKAVQISVKAGRVGGFLLRALMAALVLFSARDGETAELKKLTLGYSTVGPAGIGLWMAKEIGAFRDPASMRS